MTDSMLLLCLLLLGLTPSSWSWTSAHHHVRPFRTCNAALASAPMDPEWDSPPNMASGEGYDDVDDDDEGPTDEELLATNGDWDPRVAQMNTIHLIGRIGNDPEPRHFDDGNCVVNLSLAVGRKYHYMERELLKIKYGEEETDWYGLEIWGPQAEFVSKFVDKGTRVAVTGTLHLDEWTDKTSGEKRNAVKVIVREFDVLETKAEAELRRGNSGGGTSRKSRERSFYVDDPDEYNPKSGSNGGFFD
eukprot:CAMPEP_0117027716 /NCGR_PEP_ID=MMETSP0472-20121206/20230_1 /TAXON_ID=693140 ORGANISM="Tiarina fusus, Strain LIS" /NCGR_SAMPLE_ID=MMETSP0472 /ASSEMBLY_ACC=CAM_ASM_000603 /LENGTH=245 /DNA_ID=CAMNT_0004735031 /DNA_START=14 /DNA_END=751 /DNA_ORIENTATION=+